MFTLRFVSQPEPAHAWGEHVKLARFQRTVPDAQAPTEDHGRRILFYVLADGFVPTGGDAPGISG